MTDKQLFFLPPPPRSTGSPQGDLPLITDWLYKVYNGLQAYLEGQQTASFNPGTLPDPASTTLATAQTTANQAYTLANTAETAATAAQTAANAAQTSANAAQTTANTASTNATAALVAAAAAQSTANTALADAVIITSWFGGSLTISDAATSATHTFSGGESEANTNYRVFVDPVASAGSPTAGSNRVLSVTKTTSDITINVETAPGVGNSVTFDFLVLRFS